MKSWAQSDIRKLVDAALDGFAFEFFNAPNFKSLGSDEKLNIARGLKADAAERFTYLWMMRPSRRAK